jgi:hypothetical protein
MTERFWKSGSPPRKQINNLPTHLLVGGLVLLLAAAMIAAIALIIS